MNIENHDADGHVDPARQLARIDGALLVVRTLVHSQLQRNPVALSQADITARYCQLLATRTKISPMDAHRLTLAAWISALDTAAGPAAGPAAHFINDFQLDPVLHAAPGSDNTEANILRVVQTYAELHSRDPRIGRDLTLTRKAIEEKRTEPASLPAIRRLMNILKDESFLDGIHVQAEKILVVDHEEAVSPVIAPPLRNEGFEVTVCSDVPAARKKMEDFRPVIIIAAKDMPLIDGMVFCQEIKSSPATASIIFFILCPKASKAAERQCLRVGSDEVISRPVDLELLTLKIQHLLRSKAPAAAETRPAVGFAGNLAEISFTDLIQIICAGSRSLAIELRQDHHTGTVYVEEGAVIHASTDDLSGEEAFYTIMGWHTGIFTSRPCAHFPPRTIANSLMGLLMEGSRLQDERG